MGQLKFLNDFTKSLGASNWWKMTRKYYMMKNGTKVYVGKPYLAGFYQDKSYFITEKYPGISQIEQIVQKALDNKNVPYKSNAMYNVFVWKDINLDWNQVHCGKRSLANLTQGKVVYSAFIHPDVIE